MVRRFLFNFKQRISRHPKIVIGVGVGIIIGGLIIFQGLFFRDRLPLFVKVDGLDIGGWHTKDAAWEINRRYAQTEISLYAKGTQSILEKTDAKTMGISIDNHQRIEALSSPLALRLVPLSFLWSGFITKPSDVSYAIDEKQSGVFIAKTFGEDCRIEPRNAQISVEDGTFKREDSRDGGVCQKPAVVSAIKNARITPFEPLRLEVPVDILRPAIDSNSADDFIKRLEARLDGQLSIRAGDAQVPIDRQTLLSWIDIDSSGDEIQIAVAADRSQEWLSGDISKKVSIAPGITRVTTRDFVEISRQKGPDGRALDFATTRQTIADYLMSQRDTMEAQTMMVPARLEFSRSYSQSDVGFSAMLQHQVEARSGQRIAVAVIELSGNRRTASFNGDMEFISASTYKMLLAFSILKRVESGQFSWSDQVVSGLSLDQCFDAMIVRSDNACPEAMMRRIGRSQLQQDMAELGLQGTNFNSAEGVRTTANNLVKFSAMLEARQLPLTNASHDKLLAALRRNIYRQGIPAGASGPVANKVGFLSNYLNDAGVVYAPQGTYALAIMTESSSWAEIAAITREIEKFRAG